MATFPVREFLILVEGFLAGKRSWDDVHGFVIDTEAAGADNLPRWCPAAFEDLRAAFFADSRDDVESLFAEVSEKLPDSEGRSG
ncbi:MAG TPA: hypothetical protein VMG31_15635 [Verrucomicrobiae bacterium]|nr:hypothetical protein [Verrucomicrobiae bacterium]